MVLPSEFMNKQEQFELAIKYNDLQNFKALFKDKKVDPSLSNDWSIRYSSSMGRSEMVKLLLEDSRVNPATNSSESFSRAAKFGHIEVVKLLLYDNRIRPEAECNYAIINAFEKGYTDIVNLLWKNKRIKGSLQKDNSKLYNKLITDKIKNKVVNF
jgi:ankyrin repeat protein